MQKKDNKKKKEKQPGILETVRQVQHREELEKQEKLEKKLELEREEFGKKNAEEKIEVLKYKQGVSDDPDKLFHEDTRKRKYTFGQKVGNFFYHNKWWMGIAAFLVLITAYLVYDTVTTVRSDLRVMLLSDNTHLSESSRKITEFFNSCTKDYNEDGQSYTDLVYIPISKDKEENMNSAYGYENSLTNLSTQFQLGECMMLLADSAVDEYISPEEPEKGKDPLSYALEDLSVYFPDDPNVKGTKYFLKNTNFAKKIGLDSKDIPDDLYLAVRRVLDYSNLSSEETNKENHDRAVETIKAAVRELN